MNIQEILTKEGVKLNQDGKYLVGVSPLGNSKLPLLIVDSENGTFTDLSTGKSGNAVDLYAALKGCSKDTAERLVSGGKETPVSEEEKILKEIIKESNSFFKINIKKSKEAREYLYGRGFTDEDIEEFEFGYASDYGQNLYRHLLKSYSKELILKSGVCKLDKKGKIVDLFWKRVIIPIKNSEGEVVAFGGRVLDDGTPKYINSPESPIFQKRKLLYGYDVAKDIKCNAYIICEGYMDCISLHKIGLTNAVASLGTALTKSQCELLTNKKRVYVLYDTDTAGVNAMKKAIPLLENIGLETRVIDYKPCKDPDEFIKERGKEEFIARIKESKAGEKALIHLLVKDDLEKAVKYLNNMNVEQIVNLTRRNEE